MTRIVVLAFVAGCSTGPDFDGRYRVESHALDPSSCDGPGDDVALEYSTFEIRHRGFFGVTIYPVYRCDDGACAADNEAEWNLVVVGSDLDQVAFEYTINEGNTCLLFSEDLVIDAGLEGRVILQRRTFQLAIPYDPATCLPDNAAARRGEMRCASLLQLVGVPEQ